MRFASSRQNLTVAIVAASLVAAVTMAVSAEPGPTDAGTAAPGQSADAATAADTALGDIINTALDVATAETSIGIIDPAIPSALTLEIDVPTSIDLPLTLQGVVSDLEALLATSPNPSSTEPEPVEAIPGFDEGPYTVDATEYDTEEALEDLPTRAPLPVEPSATVEDPTEPTPQLDVPTRTEPGTDPAEEQVAPCHLLDELDYLEPSDQQNDKGNCPGNSDDGYDANTDLQSLTDVLKDPDAHVASRLTWELAQMQRAIHDLEEATSRKRINTMLDDMAQRANRLEGLVEGLDTQLVATANHLATAVHELAREVNDTSLQAATDQVDAIRQLASDMTELVAALSDRLLGGIRNMLDDLQLLPSLPEQLPVTVCVKVTVDGQGQTGNIDNDKITSATGGKPGQRVPLAAEDDGPASGTPMTCPDDGFFEATNVASVTRAVAPSFAGIPPEQDARELIADPSGMLDIAGGSRDVTVGVEVLLQVNTTWGDDCLVDDAGDCVPLTCDDLNARQDGACISRRLTAPEFPVAVPSIPLPTFGVGFSHRAPGGDLQWGGYFGAIVSAPGNSVLNSVDDTLDTISTILIAVDNVETAMAASGASPTDDLLAPANEVTTQLDTLTALLDGSRAEAQGVTDVGVTFNSSDDNLHDRHWITRVGAADIRVGDEVRSGIVIGSRAGATWCWDSIKDVFLAAPGVTRAVPSLFDRENPHLPDLILHGDDPGLTVIPDQVFHSQWPFAGSGSGTQGNHHYGKGLMIEDGVSRWWWGDSGC